MAVLASEGFFGRRWHGKVPLQRLLWRDMLGIGSLLNLACSVLALVIASRGTALGLAVIVYFAPLPYNASCSQQCATRRSATLLPTPWLHSG